MLMNWNDLAEELLSILNLVWSGALFRILIPWLCYCGCLILNEPMRRYSCHSFILHLFWSSSAHPFEGQWDHHLFPYHEQRHPDRRGDQSKWSLLLCSWSIVPPQLHLQVQSDSRRSSEEALTPRMPQCFSPWWCPSAVGIHNIHLFSLLNCDWRVCFYSREFVMGAI